MDSCCKYFRHLYCISLGFALCIVCSPLLSPASLPVRQLPIPPPWRPNILALHKFLMSVLKSPATSTHWSFNLLRQTNIMVYTCFNTFSSTHFTHALRGPGLEVLRGYVVVANSKMAVSYPTNGKKRQKRSDCRILPVWPC